MTPRLLTIVAGRALRLVAGLAVLAALTGGVVVAVNPALGGDPPATPATEAAAPPVPASPVPPLTVPAPVVPAAPSTPVPAEPTSIAAPDRADLTDDASIRAGDHARTRLGTDADLEAKRGSTDVTRAVLLRFALDGIDLGEGDRAVLRLSNPSLPGQALELRRTRTDWDERTVTWNTRPKTAGEPRRATLRTDADGRWGEADVTAFVRAAQAGGADVLALQIRSVERTGPVVRFSARERGDGGLAPQLLVRAAG